MYKKCARHMEGTTEGWRGRDEGGKEGGWRREGGRVEEGRREGGSEGGGGGRERAQGWKENICVPLKPVEGVSEGSHPLFTAHLVMQHQF